VKVKIIGEHTYLKKAILLAKMDIIEIAKEGTSWIAYGGMAYIALSSTSAASAFLLSQKIDNRTDLLDIIDREKKRLNLSDDIVGYMAEGTITQDSSKYSITVGESPREAEIYWEIYKIKDRWFERQQKAIAESSCSQIGFLLELFLYRYEKAAFYILRRTLEVEVPRILHNLTN